jgi:hypothetical protein
MSHRHARARRGLRALLALPITALTLAIAPSSAVHATSPAAAPTRGQVARWGAGWLARQITANGGHLVSFGAPDPTDTAYAVLGLHAAGVGRDAASAAVAYLETELTDAVQSGGSDSAGALADYIMAARAERLSPRQFGGKRAVNDLVARLLATQRNSGADAGLFGAQLPTFDGAFRQGLALAALAAAGVPKTNARVQAGIAWLERQQCANGLWEAYRSDTSTPCPPADPNTFTGPDTNSTGAAVQGLAAYGERPHKAATLRAFDTIQSSDGGFPFVAAAGLTSDPDSTALMLQALLALGENPTATRWLVGGASAFDALASYQLGCTAPGPDRGAFFFPGSTDPNIFATVQSVPAMAAAALPVDAGHPSTAAPKPACG